MEKETVTVVGATGTLGSYIVEELRRRGTQVRAMVRSTSDLSLLQKLGVRDFVVADLNDRVAVHEALAMQPRARAVISSAAGFTAHSAHTKGDNSRTDIEGYRNLVDATLAAGVPRFVLISILACDQAAGVPHFYQKYETEKYLASKSQPFLSLRAGAFLDRASDIVPENIRKGVFPDILPGVPMALVYSRDLARYAVQSALDVSDEAFSHLVDIGCDVPATGDAVAASFTKLLGRPIVAKPVYPRILFTILPYLVPFAPRLRDNLAVLKWLRKGEYVNRDTATQKRLFGDLPTIEQAVERYCLDKGLLVEDSRGG